MSVNITGDCHRSQDEQNIGKEAWKVELVDRKLPVGIQSFEQIITDHYLIVDKTAYIYDLVHTGKSYFLSRPRRFGKSLLLSTMKAYWEGKKELFDGLKIAELEKNNPDAWQPYPVFYFDFNKASFADKGVLESIIEIQLLEWEKKYGKTLKKAPLGARFGQLLRAASEQTGKRCVVLVDEYDKKLLETMENKELVEHNNAVFKGFFSTLKSEDAHIQFIFITGVTKFSKVSIFSDLNQLEDLSFDNDYSGICGMTEEEILGNFEPEIERMAKERSLTQVACMEKLRKMYDGYHFSADGVGVYNPYSLLTALKKRRFGSFWYETGTPTFLVHRLKELDFDIRQLSDRTLESTEMLLSDYRIENPDPVPLLYQTGYLTIVDSSDQDVYTLGLPNDEVRYAFLQSLMPEYINEYGSGSGKDVFTLKRHVANGNLEGIKNIFTALFASITYTTSDTPFEHYFQTVIYITLTLLGQYAHCEQHTNTGRIDCTVETKDYVYIFEFKRDDSAENALKQINDMHYADPYAADNRKLYKIGVNFDSKTRQMTEWKVEEF